VRVVDCVLLSMEVKRSRVLGPTLSGVPGVCEGVALQELRHGIGDRSASEDSDGPCIPRMGASWGRGPRMDGTEKVSFTNISQIMGTH